MLNSFFNTISVDIMLEKLYCYIGTWLFDCSPFQVECTDAVIVMTVNCMCEGVRETKVVSIHKQTTAKPWMQFQMSHHMFVCERVSEHVKWD